MLKLIEYGLIWFAVSFVAGIPFCMILKRCGHVPEMDR